MGGVGHEAPALLLRFLQALHELVELRTQFGDFRRCPRILTRCA
jgi:hypothetical protein